MTEEIKEILEEFDNLFEISEAPEDIINDFNKIKNCFTNLQQKVDQYENPDDMTLFYMWLDEKAKDKIKKLQQENKKLKERLDILEK